MIRTWKTRLFGGFFFVWCFGLLRRRVGLRLVPNDLAQRLVETFFALVAFECASGVHERRRIVIICHCCLRRLTAGPLAAQGLVSPV